MRFGLMVWMLLVCWATAQGQEIREYMDLQCHGTMHMAHPIFKQNLLYFDPANPPELTYNHTLTNVNYANYWEDNKGARIIINGAIVKEFWVTPKKARESILEQLKYVNDFAAAHPDKFVVAKTPQEVRHYINTTNKTVIIHSVEGAEKIIHNQADACFWADQGIAFMTLIHLIDGRFGGAAILPDAVTKIINFRGSFRSIVHGSNSKGLTEEGKRAIVWLANAGIITDITHMSPNTRADALAFMEAQGIAPISTHEGFQPIQNNARALTPEQILLIYRIGGLVSLPVAINEHNPYPEYQARIDALPNFCPGSIDSYKFTYQIVDSLIRSYSYLLLGTSFDDLPEAKKVLFSIGFQTDFNGWTSHERPRVGPEGCYPIDSPKTYNPIETLGMPHPGMLEHHWQWLTDEGVDLAPIKRSSERFLQIWEGFLVRRGSYDVASKK